MSKKTSIHGKHVYTTHSNQLVGRSSVGSGGEGKPKITLPGSPDTVAIWDDFLNDTGRPLDGTDYNWRVLDGDTGAVATVGVVPGTSGILRMALGATPIAQTKMGITGSLAWKANQSRALDNGEVRFGARVKLSGEFKDTGRSLSVVWMGFTDTIAAEAPVVDTGGAVVSVASNAVGIAWSTGGDTGWVGYGVNADSNTTPVALGVAPTANKYNALEIALTPRETDSGVMATFYVDGAKKGSVDYPVQETVALAPQIMLWGDTGGGQQLDVDWINVSAPRDTGV